MRQNKFQFNPTPYINLSTSNQQPTTMKKLIPHFLLAAMILTGSSLKAHISYSAGTTRDLGTFSVTGLESAVTKSNTVTSNFGWSSGTDANLGDTHKLRGLRFTLLNTGLVTIRVEGLAVGSVTALSNPGFSLYKGLAHVSPSQLDHDTSPISAAYNNATYGTNTPNGTIYWQGSFNALGDWKIGNDDDGLTLASLSSFTYVGNAADGTSALFGTAPGINGDGNADGTLSRSFALSAGDYSIFVGGAEYFGTSNVGADTTTSFAFNTTLSVAVIPEPSTYALFGLGALLITFAYRRRVAYQA
jgi:hypothetical protein